MTYPYMHDERFRNLKQVLNHYTRIDEFGLETDTDVKQIQQLSEIDNADIIAFLKTLTDKEFLYDRRFADPGMR